LGKRKKASYAKAIGENGQNVTVERGNSKKGRRSNGQYTQTNFFMLDPRNKHIYLAFLNNFMETN